MAYDSNNPNTLIQIKLRTYRDYDILKCVYQNDDTLEISVVEVLKDEKDFDDKLSYLDCVFNTSDSLEFDFLVQKYKIPLQGSLYFSKERKRLCVYVKK